MKVLVTGATGFVGKHVINALLKTDVQIFASGTGPKSAFLSNFPKDVTYFQADLNTKKKDWYSYFLKPDVVIHLAWEGLPKYSEMFHLERNLPNNYHFLSNLIHNGLKSLVVTGTCLEYGMRSGALREDMISDPDTSYAIAKDTLRKSLQQLNRLHHFDFKWVRLFYMYGSGQSPNSLLAQLELAIERGDRVFNMSAGEQLRDYLPVEKVAENIVGISLQDKTKGIINCCSGEPVSIRNLVERYLKDRHQSMELNLGYYSYPKYESLAFWGDRTKLATII